VVGPPSSIVALVAVSSLCGAVLAAVVAGTARRP
jgi:hypothetical protein